MHQRPRKIIQSSKNANQNHIQDRKTATSEIQRSFQKLSKFCKKFECLRNKEARKLSIDYFDWKIGLEGEDIGFLILADGKSAGLDYSKTVEKNVLLVFHDHHVFCVVRNGSIFFLLDPAKEIVENIFSLSFFLIFELNLFS